MMVYLRFHLLILVFFRSLIIITLIFLIFFCQLIFSSSKFNNQALTIVKSIDDYLCQNYVFTCFFRQRYHQSYIQQQLNNCKSFLILHSCLHYDKNSIHICHQTTLNQAKLSLANETPLYCLSSSIYKTFFMQHLPSRALLKTTINWQIFILFFLLFISFVIRMNMCY